jgi:beta-1,4-N-acetylglucosaminyltransferase
MVLRLLGVLRNCPIVFVESVCRVRTLSLTGRILYPWADLFAVHWPELHERYPETVVLESFVVHRQRSSCNEPASD